MRMRTMARVTAVLAAVAALAILAASASAQMWGPGRMHGFGLQAPGQPGGTALTLDQAVTRARQYLGQYRNPDLVPAEIIEFSNVFYVTVKEKSTGKGAFAVLVNRYNGNVTPEIRPPMMWNTKYGRVGAGPGTYGPGMMGGGMMGYGPGGMGPGMMGRGRGPAPGATGQRPATALDEAKARAALAAWLARAFPGAGIGKVVEFPGFYTYRLVHDGNTFALASVNAYGGQVWYAWHYGTVVREQVVR
jgi:hypothetical protein